MRLPLLLKIKQKGFLIMKSYLKSTCLTLFAAFFCANAFALPVGGQWASDRAGRSEWLEEESLNRIDSINMVLCFVRSFWVEGMVGRGPFKAQVDEGRCDNQESKMREVVARLDITASGSTNGHLWIRHDQPEDLNHYGQHYILYANMEVFESPSPSNPNGRMTVSWNALAISNDRLLDAGTMTASASGFTLNSKWLEGSEFFYTRVYLSGTTESSSGAIRYDRESGSSMETVTSLVGTNPSTYCRTITSTNDTQCFLRSRTASGAQRYSWRYGLYDSLGNRFDLPNPGFNIRGPDNAWGSANRWGVWNNSRAWANGSAVRQVSGQNIGKTYAYYSFDGKIERELSQNKRTLVMPSDSLRTFECTDGFCVTARSIADWVNGTNSNPYVNTSQTYTYQNGIFRDSTNAPVVSDSRHNGIWIRLQEVVGGSSTGNFSYTTGPNSWQKVAVLKDPTNSNQYVTFSDPINFTYTPPGGVPTTLSFDGFGSSLGIPSTVYRRSDRTVVDQTIPNWNQTICNNGSNCIWVPQFLIDDRQVSINGSTYFIQWLEAALLPAAAGTTIPSDLVLGNASNLPSGEPNTGVKSLIGPIPALSATDPYAVIDGQLQSNTQ
jgi:hypothetical protein